MRYISFRVNGRSTFGLVNEERVVDLGARFGSFAPDLTSYLTALSLGFVAPRMPPGAADYALADISYEPVCRPGKVIGVGLNYDSHRQEAGRPRAEYPTLFTRFADTLIGHGAPILRPQISTALDYEGELAVVIGRAGHRIPKAEAFGYVAGYACFNDASIRDWQRHTQQLLPGKNFPATGAFGPELVTPDEVGPLDALRIETRLNDAVVQSATLGEMIFSVADIIAYVSSFTRLAPGDTIATGTPGGVGFKREPPLFMKAGDIVDVIIERVGHLRNGVTDEAVPMR